MTLHHPTRRGLIGGLGLLFAAPAIVKASSLMKVRALPEPVNLTASEVLWLQEEAIRRFDRNVMVFLNNVLLQPTEFVLERNALVLKRTPPEKSTISISYPVRLDA
jgi:hypothetical protein